MAEKVKVKNDFPVRRLGESLESYDQRKNEWRAAHPPMLQVEKKPENTATNRPPSTVNGRNRGHHQQDPHS